MPPPLNGLTLLICVASSEVESSCSSSVCFCGPATIMFGPMLSGMPSSDFCTRMAVRPAPTAATVMAVAVPAWLAWPPAVVTAVVLNRLPVSDMVGPALELARTMAQATLFSKSATRRPAALVRSENAERSSLMNICRERLTILP